MVGNITFLMIFAVFDPSPLTLWINWFLVLISPVCPEAPRGRICTKSVTAVGAADVITCTNFFGDRSRGVDSVGVENCYLPLTKPLAVNTGLATVDTMTYIGLCG